METQTRTPAQPGSVQQLTAWLSQGRRRYVVVGLIVLVLLMRRGGGSGGTGTLDYRELLGRSPSDPAVASLISGHCSHEMNYLCRRDGVEFAIGENGRIRTVFLYAQGADGFAAYTGALPLDLRWGQTRAEVEARLGPPDDGGGVAEIYAWASYRSPGVLITYDTFDPSDLQARLRSVSIHTIAGGNP